MIGNIVEESEQFGEIIGYENHSGKTYLSKTVEPLAKIKSGAGNTPDSDFEGARYKKCNRNISSWFDFAKKSKNFFIF